MLPGRIGPTGTRLPPAGWDRDQATERMLVDAHTRPEHPQAHCNRCTPGHDPLTCVECIAKELE